MYTAKTTEKFSQKPAHVSPQRRQLWLWVRWHMRTALMHRTAPCSIQRAQSSGKTSRTPAKSGLCWILWKCTIPKRKEGKDGWGSCRLWQKHHELYKCYLWALVEAKKKEPLSGEAPPFYIHISATTKPFKKIAAVQHSLNGPSQNS